MAENQMIGFTSEKKEIVLSGRDFRFEVKFTQPKKRGRPKKNNPLNNTYIIEMKEGAACCEIADELNKEFEKHKLPVKAGCNGTI